MRKKWWLAKNLWLFFLYWFVLYFVIEWGMGLAFDDQVAIWKLLAVSAITSVMMVWPYRNRGADFKFSHTLKWQNFSVPASQNLGDDFYAKLGKDITLQNAKNVVIYDDKINFRWPTKMASFGAKVSVFQRDGALHFQSRPLFYLDIFDGGLAREQLLALRAKAEKLLR